MVIMLIYIRGQSKKLKALHKFMQVAQEQIRVAQEQNKKVYLNKRIS